MRRGVSRAAVDFLASFPLTMKQAASILGCTPWMIATAAKELGIHWHRGDGRVLRITALLEDLGPLTITELGRWVSPPVPRTRLIRRLYLGREKQLFYLRGQEEAAYRVAETRWSLRGVRRSRAAQALGLPAPGVRACPACGRGVRGLYCHRCLGSERGSQRPWKATP